MIEDLFRIIYIFTGYRAKDYGRNKRFKSPSRNKKDHQFEGLNQQVSDSGKREGAG